MRYSNLEKLFKHEDIPQRVKGALAGWIVLENIDLEKMDIDDIWENRIYFEENTPTDGAYKLCDSGLGSFYLL